MVWIAFLLCLSFATHVTETQALEPVTPTVSKKIGIKFQRSTPHVEGLSCETQLWAPLHPLQSPLAVLWISYFAPVGVYQCAEDNPLLSVKPPCGPPLVSSLTKTIPNCSLVGRSSEQPPKEVLGPVDRGLWPWNFSGAVYGPGCFFSASFLDV